MNQFVSNIVSAGTGAITEGLALDPNIKQEDFNAAIDLGIAQLQAAKDQFGSTSTDSEVVKIEKLVGYGLTGAQNACDAAGLTKYDNIFAVAEKIDLELETGSFNFITAIKNWIEAKKAAKEATAA